MIEFSVVEISAICFPNSIDLSSNSASLNTLSTSLTWRASFPVYHFPSTAASQYVYQLSFYTPIVVNAYGIWTPNLTSFKHI